MDFDPQAIRAFEHAGWQRAASRYGGTFAAATRGFIAALLDAARVGAHTRVLDVACGPGYVAAAAAARGASAAGVDFSPAMLDVARAAHPRIEFAAGDAEELAHPDGSFDAVVSNFGIHHVPRPAVAIAQARRVLAPGGRVAFTVWAGAAHNTAWQLIFDAISRHGNPAAAKAPPPGGSLNTADACAQALVQAGFGETDAQLVRRDWPLANAHDLLDALLNGTARMAALIGAQEPSALPAIAADVAEHAEIYRQGDRLRIPIAAILASGMKLSLP
jgi:SAM-dependent methyltransferase